jgi:hypothetical protein
MSSRWFPIAHAAAQQLTQVTATPGQIVSLPMSAVPERWQLPGAVSYFASRYIVPNVQPTLTIGGEQVFLRTEGDTLKAYRCAVLGDQKPIHRTRRHRSPLAATLSAALIIKIHGRLCADRGSLCVNSLSALLSPREFEIGVLRCTGGHSPVSSGTPERVRAVRECGPAPRDAPDARSSGRNRRRTQRTRGGGCVKRQPGDVLLAERNGSPSWVRTSDPRINSPLLCQLSYRGTRPARGRLVAARDAACQGREL